MPLGGRPPASAACGPGGAPSGFRRSHPVGQRVPSSGARRFRLILGGTASEALWEGVAPDCPQVTQPGPLASSQAVPAQGPPAPSVVSTAGARAARRVSVAGLARWPGGLAPAGLRQCCLGPRRGPLLGARGQGHLLGGAACPPPRSPHPQRPRCLHICALVLGFHLGHFLPLRVTAPGSQGRKFPLLSSPGSAGWKAVVLFGLIHPGLARCAHRRSCEKGIDCLALMDGLRRLSLGGVFARGR